MIEKANAEWQALNTNMIEEENVPLPLVRLKVTFNTLYNMNQRVRYLIILFSYR